ncbi:MAG: D-alanyl-D-alanine carboxypeptidase/D-alanyl-D-alanine endopeptidase [Pyrinomonadaceae bacterium]
MFYSSTRRSCFSAFFLLSAILFFSSCRLYQPTENAAASSPQPQIILPDSGEADFQVPAPNINLANPLVVSQRPDDVALCDKINRTIDESPYTDARWGFFAVSLKDGRVVCSRDGRKLFNPASIEKTLTAIVALDKLGADFRWKTSVYAAKQLGADGTIDGDLTLYGTGAPDFDSAALENLVAQLQAKGLKHIKGNVVGDASFFRGDTIGDGWTWNELQWYYGAEASALTFNENEGFVNVENGIGKASNDYLHVAVGEDSSANSQNTEVGGIKRGLEDNNFYIWGSSKNFGARVSIHNPAELAAKTLKESLEKKGITIDGTIQSRDWKSTDQLDVSKSVELASVESAGLGEIVKKMNKHSINLYGELILRTVGKKFSDEVPGNIQLPQNVRGDDIVGAAIVKKWMIEHKAATDEIEIHDGSGLSRIDFVTPEVFAKAFIYAAQSPFAKVFTDSLPIGGTDGTLGGRFGNVKGKVIAKTGTITFVNSLAGYAANKEGEVFTFSIISNNDTRKNGIHNVMDKAVTYLVTGIEDNSAANTNAQKQDNSSNTNQNNGFYEQHILNNQSGR